MTDYNKWNKFNEDEVSKEIADNDNINEVKSKSKKKFNTVMTSNEMNVLNAQKQAQALQSQVDGLKTTICEYI